MNNKDNINSSNEEMEQSAPDAVDACDGFDDGDDFSDAANDASDAEGASVLDLPLDIDEGAAAPISRRDARKAKKKKAAVKKEKSPRKRVEITKTVPFKICVTVISLIAILSVAAYVACIMALPSNTVARNVMIENIDVSGLTYSETLNKIKSEPILGDRKITITHALQSYEINGEDVALSASAKETAKLAYKYGKSGNKLYDGLTAFTLLFCKHTITPSAVFDAEAMSAKITEFGNQIYGERKNHYVEIGDGKAIVWPGVTGFNGDLETALAEITEAVMAGKYSGISVTLASAPPDELTVDDFDGAVYADPVNAHYEIIDNELKIVDETNGRYIDKEAVAPLLTAVREGGEPVEIPFNYSYPEIKASDLSDRLFADTMASYSTSYASSGYNRASNVARAASLINGKLIMPGEVFSFNAAVGARSVANGFKTAPEYVNGKTVDGIGGGTCQVSTTLYNAVLYADLEIVSRTNHMFTVGYAPNGQDATVADSGVDFKFKNNSPYPIKISSHAGGGTITVSIIGTNYNPKHEVKISNSTSYSANGDTYVSSKRTVYANGEVIKTEALPSSLYKKHVEESAEPSREASAAVSAPSNPPQTAASEESDNQSSDASESSASADSASPSESSSSSAESESSEESETTPEE